MTKLRRSTDRKTANSATAGANVRIANAFGLLSGKANSCPGATSVCESVCYAGRIEKQYKNVHSVMSDNFDLIRSVDLSGKISLLSAMIDEFRAECVKYDAPMEFRIHHDGDFYSLDYAIAWRRVIRANPDIQFWAYTRSHRVVPMLANEPNLALYISVDRDNAEMSASMLRTFPRVRAAVLAETQAEAAIIMREIGRRRPGASCPENVKRIPLITSEGGACHSCQLCVVGKSDVRFSSKRK